jgi:hypothetical protein
MAELADAADSKSAGTWYLGGSTPPPGTSTFGVSRLQSLPSASPVFREMFQGRKVFAHEPARVCLEVCSYRKKVALLQTCHRKKWKNQTGLVIVRGKEERHPEGNFYLHRYEGGKEIWKRIGPNPQEAVNAADFESTYLAARAKGIPQAKRYAGTFYQSSCARLVGGRETFESVGNV